MKTLIYGWALLLPFFPNLLKAETSKLDELARFSGHRMDHETGLIYAKARYYDSSLGTFTSPDFFFVNHPKLCVDSYSQCNLLAYVSNNPLSLIDPLGRYEKSLSGTIGKFKIKMKTKTSVDKPKAGDRYMAGADVSVNFKPDSALKGRKLGFIQFKDPLTKGPFKRTYHNNWAVDRADSAKTAYYGMKGNDDGTPTASAVVNKDGKALAYFSKDGKKNAGLIDTPNDMVEGGKKYYAKFVSAIYDVDTSEFLGAVEWGYKVNSEGEMAISEPKYLDALNADQVAAYENFEGAL